MRATTLIGIDIGTQGVKAALFTPDGRCLADAFVKSKLRRRAPGRVEEDPEFQVRSVCRAVNRCMAAARCAPRSVAGMAIAGQMAGLLGVGEDGRHLTPYDSWLDTRCAPYIARMEQCAGAEILRKTGCPPSFNHGPKILWWMHERKSVFNAIRAFVQPGAYAAMRLCGLDAARAFIDRTYLHFSGFADNRRSRWDPALCNRFGLDPAKLPAIVAPNTVVGRLTAAAARRCGLRPGVPLVAGCGDTAASFLACGATAEGVCVDVAGTASVFAATAARFRPDTRRRMLACGQAAVPGLWHAYAYVNGGGMNLEWFRREIAGRPAPGRRTLTFDRLNREAAALPFDADTPLFVPHFAGRVCPSQPGLRGAWAGLRWTHTRAHLYRAMLEAVALEYGIYRNAIAELYPDLRLRDVRVTGGGEKSAVWNRIKAAVLNMPVVQVRQSLGAPMGAALLAGDGLGLFKDLRRTADRWVRTGERHRAGRKMTAFYQPRLRQYEELLTVLATQLARERASDSPSRPSRREAP
ncbi:MAG: xylulose kinase [Kiritimatiellae bacterium]|nr:xylulose kinase [Kiritimatiellia bacterium]